MTERRSFPAEASSVKEARRFIAAALTDVDPHIVEIAMVILSELATNSVRHAMTTFQITVDRSPELLRVEVADGSRHQPVIRHPDPQQPTGRGLQIVDTLAAEWGVTDISTGGKAVWFSLALAT
jgi:two-component sensor histidine kinase